MPRVKDGDKTYTVKQGDRLRITKTVYDGRPGWLVSGKKNMEPGGWPVSIFVEGPRSNAERVKANVRLNLDDVFTGIER